MAARYELPRNTPETYASFYSALAQQQQRACHHHGRWPGHAALSVDPRTRQAGRAARRKIPARRHPHLELHQLRLPPSLPPHAVQFRLAPPAHLAVLQVRPLLRRLRRTARGRTDLRQHLLVSGHGRRREEEPRPFPEQRFPIRPHPQRRPALPDGLPEDPRPAHPDLRGHHRRHHSRGPRSRRGSRHPPDRRREAHHPLRGEAEGSRGPRLAQDPPLDEPLVGDAGRRGPVSRLDGHLRLQPRRAHQAAGQHPDRLRQTHHPRGHRVPPRLLLHLPGILGGHRDHPRLLRGEPRCLRRASALQLLRHGFAHLHASTLPPGVEDQRRRHQPRGHLRRLHHQPRPRGEFPRRHPQHHRGGRLPAPHHRPRFRLLREPELHPGKLRPQHSANRHRGEHPHRGMHRR